MVLIKNLYENIYLVQISSFKNYKEITIINFLCTRIFPAFHNFSIILSIKINLQGKSKMNYIKYQYETKIR